MASGERSSVMNLSGDFFGRTTELAQLGQVIQSCRVGGVAWAMVRAEAGMGKSSLVHEGCRVHGQGMFFMAGKCEAFVGESPYRPVVQALTQAAHRLLSSDSRELNRVSAALREALGEALGLLVDLVPAFGACLGQSVPKGLDVEAGEAARDQFEFAVRSVLRTLASAEHPVIFWIDDLQWADDATLHLLATLASDVELHHLVVLGCYRSEEVGPVHALQPLLSVLAARRLDAETREDPLPDFDVELTPLVLDDLQEFVGDMLEKNGTELTPLSEYLLDKSGGNPLFCREVLATLVTHGDLTISPSTNDWTWRPPVQADDHPMEHVGALVKNRIGALGADVQETLQLAACLGASFTMRDLAIVTDRVPDDLDALLGPALAADVLCAESDGFRFAHDTVLEAIIGAATAGVMSRRRATVGWALYEHLGPEERRDRQFELVGHMAETAPADITDDRRLELASQALAASRRALAAAAYRVALRFARLSHEHLHRLPDVSSDQLFEVRLEEGRAAYLCGEQYDARAVAEALLDNARTFRQQREAFRLYKDIIVSSGSKFDRAVGLGLSILEAPSGGLGASEIGGALNDEFNMIQGMKLAENPMEIFDHPPPEDPLVEERLALIADIWEAAYYAGDEKVVAYCSVRMARESLEHGVTRTSAFGFVLMGLEMLKRGRPKRAVQYGALALRINTATDYPPLIPKVNNLYCNYLGYLTEPFSELAARYDRSARIGRELGDMLFGLWASLFAVWTRLIAGVNLREVYARSEELLPFVEETRDEKIIHAFLYLRRMIRRLYSGEFDRYGEHDEAADAALACWDEHDFIPGRTWKATLDGQRQYIDGRYEESFNTLSDKSLTDDLMIVMFPLTQLVIYRGLSAAALLEGSSPGSLEDVATQLNEDTATIAGWASTNPHTFQPVELVLRAASACHEGDSWRAAQLYEEALASATSPVGPGGEDTGVHIIAAIHEHSARFLTTAGFAFGALAHRRAAEAAYASWGASAKAAQLRVQAEPEVPQASFGHLARPLHGSVLEQVISASQDLANEVSTERLTRATLETIVARSGATRGVLLQVQDDVPTVVAAGVSGQPATAGFSTDLAGFPDLPGHLLRLISRTGTPVVIEDASRDENHYDDTYMQGAGVKSVLCVPARYQGQVVAVAYLENTERPGVFDEGLVGIIQVLLGQATVSLANAKLEKTLRAEVIEHREAEDARRLSEARLLQGHLFAQMGVWELSLSDSTMYWSENIASMLGEEPGERWVSLETCLGLIHEPDQRNVRNAFRECMESGVFDETFRVVVSSGELRWVRASAQLVRSDSGAPEKVIGVVHDVTDRLEAQLSKTQLEEQLNRAQRMESLGLLTGGIAHDFNNILAAIMGNAELLEDEVDISGFTHLKGSVDTIFQASMRGKALVAKLMAYGRGGDSPAGPLRLGQPVELGVDMLRAALPATITCRVIVDPTDPTVLMSSVDVHQIIMNAGVNARDAMHGRGVLAIGVRSSRSVADVCASCHHEFRGNYVELFVSDTGDGIHEDALDRIFEPFYTEKLGEGGTGLGLAVVHGLIHNVGGHILVTTEEGAGTTFHFLFPELAVGEAETGATSEAVAPSTDGGLLEGRILVVDDEPEVSWVLAQLLEKVGCTVVAETSAVAALDLFRADPHAFDVVITDQTMPEMTGIEFAADLLRVRPDIPIVVCSGFTLEIDETNYEELGFRAFFLKPIPRAAMIDCLRRLLGGGDG